MRILFWPFRMPGMFIITAIVVLLAVGLMGNLGSIIDRTLPDSEIGGGVAGCLATILLGLYALGMARLPGVIKSKVIPAFAPSGSWLVRIPTRYHRTCQNCDYSWIWDPKNPTQFNLPQSSLRSADQRQQIVHEASSPTNDRNPTKVDFHCPDCHHESSFNPWIGPANCPKCGYTAGTGKQTRRAMKSLRLESSQPYLRDFLNFWHGVPLGASPFNLDSDSDKIASFSTYRECLGEDLRPSVGQYYHSGYFRRHTPSREDILSFLDAYHMLREGNKEKAQDKLLMLSIKSPDFVEPWLWLAVTASDPIDCGFYLETVYQKAPAHPLVIDVYSIIRGGVTYYHANKISKASTKLEAQHCPSCGGSLHYDAGATEVMCSYCGHRVVFQPMFNSRQVSNTVSGLRLQRKILGQSWKDIDRILSCEACGSHLTMTESLAKTCSFCGSPNVIIEDQIIALEQPDGFIPFQIGEQSARKAIQRHRPSPFWDFRGWRRFNRLRVKHLKGVYLPFWVFDGVVEPIWAQVHRDGTHSKLDGPVARFTAHDLMFSGTDRPPPSQLDEVSKFDIGALVEYMPELLADWPAMLYDFDVEIAVEDAYDVMIALAQDEMGPPILSGTDLKEGSKAVRSLQVSQTTYQLILLPIWIAHLESPDAIALALVNGQNGDSTFSMVLVK